MRLLIALRTLALLPLSLAVFAEPLSAQTSAERNAGIGGFVLVAPGDVPLAGVEVSIVELKRVVTTDSVGAYRFLNVAPGDYTLTARMVGYGALNARVTLTADRVLAADLEMERLTPPQLDRVLIRADSVLHGTAIGMAMRERATAGGLFMHAAALDSARGTSVAELLRKFASGARIIHYAARDAYLLASGRGLTSISMKLPQADIDDGPAACYCQVIINGARVYKPGEKAPVPDLSRYDASLLEGLEYYPGPALTPPEYGGTGANCGTLVLWMRVH